MVRSSRSPVWAELESWALLLVLVLQPSYQHQNRLFSANSLATGVLTCGLLSAVADLI